MYKGKIEPPKLEKILGELTLNINFDYAYLHPEDNYVKRIKDELGDILDTSAFKSIGLKLGMALENIYRYNAGLCHFKYGLDAEGKLIIILHTPGRGFNPDHINIKHNTGLGLGVFKVGDAIVGHSSDGTHTYLISSQSIQE